MTAQTCLECAFFKRGYRLQGMKVPDFCSRHLHTQHDDDPACATLKEKADD